MRPVNGGVPRRIMLIGVLVGMFLLMACRPSLPPASSSAGGPDVELMTECQIEATRIAREQEALKAQVRSQEAQPADPRWYRAELTDVRTGDTFTLADFQGQIVLVETTAVWCALCLQQQMHERSLLEQGIAGVVFVSLDIDPNESAEVLAKHAAKHHFDWRFAIAPREVARALQEQFGGNVLHPPAVPLILIDGRGRARLLPLGVKSADFLAEELASVREG